MCKRVKRSIDRISQRWDFSRDEQRKGEFSGEFCGSAGALFVIGRRLISSLASPGVKRARSSLCPRHLSSTTRLRWRKFLSSLKRRRNRIAVNRQDRAKECREGSSRRARLYVSSSLHQRTRCGVPCRGVALVTASRHELEKACGGGEKKKKRKERKTPGATTA